MKPGREFDKLIRQRIEESESEFAFDESNWQKAAKMMDAERGAVGFRNNKKFLLAGALCLIMGSVGFFGYKYLNPDGIAGKENMVSEQAVKNTGEISSANGTGNSQTTEKQIAENSTQVNPVSLNETNEKANSETTGNIKANNETSATNEPNLMLRDEPPVKGKNNLRNGSENKSFVNGTPGNSKAKASGKNEAAQEITPSNSSVSETQVIAGNDGANMYENLFLNTKVTKMPAHNLDGDLRKTSYDFIRIYKDDFYTRKRKTCYLDAEAGSTYLFGWDTKKGKDGVGFNAYAGVNFGFHIKKKLSASIGAQFYNIGNIKQAFYTGSSINYDFGANGTYTAITTNNLAYFAIPVKVNYAIDKRNTIGVGVNTALLFNGRNTIETYSMSDGVKSNVQTQNNTGYYEGTHVTNVMLTAFYSRAVTRRMKLNAEVMYGISDIYNNTATATTKEKSTGVRLGLQYTLFSK